MKTIVFIGTQKSGSSRSAIKAAEELGYFTVLLTDRPPFIEKRTEFTDVHLMQLCNLNDLEELRGILQGLSSRALNICSIISFTDPHCHTACILADELGINHFTTEAVEKMQSKLLSRKLLSASPYVPDFFTLSDISSLSKKEVKQYLPVILKSPDSSGSKDVFRAQTYKEFTRYFSKLVNRYPDKPVLAEEFLDGPQYLVETLVFDNKAHIVAVFEQEITFKQKFIVTGYSLKLDLPQDFYENLKMSVEAIIDYHGLKCGPCHLEMRYVKEQWKLIEVNPRISGGGMNNMIEAGFGINLVKETLKMALGKEPDLNPKYKKYTFAQYVTVSEAGVLEKVTGKNKALKCPGVQFVYVKPKKGTTLVPPVSMGNRYAYVIANGESEEEAKQNSKQAASLINFSLLPIPGKKQNEITIEEGLEKFEASLLAQSTNEKTTASYTSDILGYFNWYENNFNNACTLLNHEDMLAYKSYLINERQNLAKTINRKLLRLIEFNDFLITQGFQKNKALTESDLIAIQQV